MAEKISIENNDDSLQKTIGVFGEDWVKCDPIGSGGFGTIYLLKSVKDNSEPKYVVKEILGFENNEHKKNCEVKYTLVLVGICRQGKSASGNTLLGSRVFHEYNGYNPGTLNVCKGKAKIQGELFEVFDKPDWEKGDPIGSGGFGTVYLVKSLRDNSEPKYVVKEILVFETSENKHFVGSLKEYSKKKKGLGEEETRRFTRQILEGLAFLHEHNIIHRDVKGANVLMEDESHVRLTDFGISKILQDVSSTSTSGVGTERWMAPEVMNTQASKLKYNEKADIW
ncbi:mitogen-activated protein kinase kinase kinase 2-like [Physella acuta]|uniref:mitogen-activated protein kinase kinase kinase 2-like n=1 Tax=Physella acuta TaxID=109671 RepID=UPI0027DE4845|nr:mitogen-activated protein kinase kinase kinase 2-like [Physella acuta]